MYGRSNSPTLNRVVSRQVVRRIHWRARVIPADWLSAHRAAQIDARCREARERHIRLMQGRSGRCGL